MVDISNGDYAQAKSLLRVLSTMRGRTRREDEKIRQAKLLLRKWDRRDKRTGA